MTWKATLRSIVVVGLWLVCSPSYAASEIQMGLTQLVERANLIGIGTVSDMHSTQRFFGDYERVVTDVSLVDIEIVKGGAAPSELIVTQFGGQVGDVVEWYPGLPTLDAERRYLMFLVYTDLDDAILIGMQGLFIVETDQERGVEVVTSAHGQPVLDIADDFVQLGAGEQEGAIDEERLSTAMTLEAFMNEIKARMN